jgi:hypothetical protein
MIEQKRWLKDMCNISSRTAIKAHLDYCQEDFRSMGNLKGIKATMERTRDWNPLNLTVDY